MSTPSLSYWLFQWSLGETVLTAEQTIQTLHIPKPTNLHALDVDPTNGVV